ncbi:MAG: ABC transporter permease [Anaerolineales bacterium]|nr:ABC transporter permease [Anaerolineales bacterium]
MLLDIALKRLWQHRLRTILTILGIAVAVQLYLISNNLMVWYEREVQRQLSGFAGKIFVQQSLEDSGFGQEFPILDSSIPASRASEILADQRLLRQESSALLFNALVSTSLPNMPPAVLAVGIEPGHEAAYLAGQRLLSGEVTLPDADSLILGYLAARHYQTDGSKDPLPAGAQIELRGRLFRVVGVLAQSSELLNNSVLMPLPTAQQLFNRQNSVSAIILTSADIAQVPALQSDLRAAYPGLDPASQKDLLRNAEEVLSLQRLLLDTIDFSVMLASVVAVAIVISILIIEQRHDIGTLRAIGARRAHIIGLVAFQALMLCIPGAILAFPLKKASEMMLDYGRVSLPIDEFTIWLGSLGATLLVGLLAALLPAWQAIRIDPLEALCYE